MKVAHGFLENAAELASLTLTESEAVELEADLEKIIAYVGELQAIDVEGVPPTTSMGSNASLRHDDPIPSLSHDAALAGAPKVEGEGFAVPAFMPDV